MPDHKAYFITLEGGEYAGKSTQAKLLAQALIDQGFNVDLTREPGGTPGAEAIRSLLLSHEHAWSPQAETLLFAAARADHIEKRIAPALRAGKVVICDRFIDSTRAYQGANRHIVDGPIMDIHRIGAGGLMPDLTILLDIPEATFSAEGEGENPLQDRIKARGAPADRMEAKDDLFHADVRHIFRQIARFESGRVVTINALAEVDRVHAQVLAVVLKRIQRKNATI